MSRLAFLRLYFLALGVFTLLWWPVSHWLYPDWYHRLLGFESYDAAMVRVIGTAGVVPMLGLFFAAADPLRNRDFVIAILAFSALMAATYVVLIFAYGFPTREYANVATLICNACVISALYPWRSAFTKVGR